MKQSKNLINADLNLDPFKTTFASEDSRNYNTFNTTGATRTDGDGSREVNERGDTTNFNNTMVNIKSEADDSEILDENDKINPVATI